MRFSFYIDVIGGTKTGHARGPEPGSPTPARLPAWELPANLLTGCGDACQVPASRGEVTARWFRRCKIGIIYLELLITYKLALSICVGACNWLHASQIRSGWRSVSLSLAVFGYIENFSRTFFEKRISYAWSTKWSLFAKPFQRWV